MNAMKKTARKKKRRINSRFALKVGRSRTGLGVFADEPIKRGVRIAEYTGRPLKPGEEYTSRSKFLFKISRTKTIDGTVKSNAARYFNHSCAPNCRAENTGRRIYIVSRRYIGGTRARLRKVARMERSVIRVFILPHSASLHAGYG